MTALMRWWKFNVVGAMGMAVQLGLLALMGRWARGHALWATAAAIEVTLLHNFAWHVRYTWRDRRDDSAMVGRLMRFHLSNGLVSMVGNLVLMWVLVRGAGLPLLVANLIAIVCCSLGNFLLGDGWTFGVAEGTAGSETSADDGNGPEPRTAMG